MNSIFSPTLVAASESSGSLKVTKWDTLPPFMHRLPAISGPRLCHVTVVSSQVQSGIQATFEGSAHGFFEGDMGTVGAEPASQVIVLSRLLLTRLPDFLCILPLMPSSSTSYCCTHLVRGNPRSLLPPSYQNLTLPMPVRFVTTCSSALWPLWRAPWRNLDVLQFKTYNAVTVVARNLTI
eukprot:126731-Rhodomonas_salina.2